MFKLLCTLPIYFLYIGFIKCENTCDVYKNNYKYLQDDYDTLYNTSFNLYKDCTSQLDNYIDLYDNELTIHDMCMENLQICENKTTNLTNTQNYTNQVKLLKQNIELESALLLQETKTKICENKVLVAYSIIAEKTQEISNLKNNITNITVEIYKVDSELKECQQNFKNNLKYQNKIFDNLNDCIEREEILYEQKKLNQF